MAWDDGLDKNSVVYKIGAADHPRVRVLAGPGTGKSFAMKRRVAKLLEAGVTPSEILAVTFTRVAAEDLHRELQKLGTPGCEDLEGQTLHSLALRILSRNHVLQALGRTPRALNRFELRALLCDLAHIGGGKRANKVLLAGYEAAWAHGQGDTPGYPSNDVEKKFQQDILSWLIFHRSMLIGELIPYLVKYLKENPAADEHNEFKHLLIDEYQDLNKAEQTALQYLGGAGQMCVVGDDDQSIYGFKYAHPDGIRNWKDANPGCIDLEMAECHRCPTKIVTMANSVIAVNPDRVPRQLVPRAENGDGEVRIVQLANLDAEAAWIAKAIGELIAVGVHPSEIVVLVQRAMAAKPIIAELKAAQIPAKSYYDESQLDSESAQQNFALFKLVLDQEDRVALRYLLGAGVGDFRAAAFARLRAHCEHFGESPWQALEKLASGTLNLPYTKSLVERFGLVQASRNELKAVEADLPTFVDLLFPASEEALSEIRALAIDQLDDSESILDLFRGMLKEISQPDVPLSVEEVRLMSLHKSKGLSSPYVFIAGCIQGILPQLAGDGTPPAIAKSRLEEARRLFYVGITRTKADPKAGRPGSLCITYPRQMLAKQAYGANVDFKSQSGAMANLIPSQFIGELGATAPAPTSE